MGHLIGGTSNWWGHLIGGTSNWWGYPIGGASNCLWSRWVESCSVSF